MLADDDIGGRTRLSRTARKAALDALLEHHPDAWVVAIRPPSGYFTSMPDSVPLAGQRVIQGPPSALELVVPSDRPVVIDTWSRAITEGEAHASVHPYGNSSRVVGMHLIDVTDEHGVYIGVFLGYGRGAGPEAAQQVLVPRTSVVRKDQVGIITVVDEAATAILGWRADELVGHRSLEFIHPDDQEKAVANWMEMVARPASSQRVKLRHRHKDGSWVWLEITNHNRLAEPTDRCVLAEQVDVTDEVAAIDALRANERVLRRLTEALPVGVLHVGADGTVDYGNERLGAIVGVDWAGTVDEQFATAVGADREVLRRAVSTVLEDGRDQDVSVSFVTKPDATVPDATVPDPTVPDPTVYCDVSLRALINEADEVVGAIVCVTDTTEDIKLREELEERARYDLLTGCLNHASVMSELAQRLPSAGSDLTVALFIDLDDFKGINDRYGHAAGDHVLRRIADSLHEVARDDDLVGRLGGDEFLVVMRAADDPRALDGICDRIATALDQSIQWGDESIAPGASVGLSFARAGSGVSADTLVSAADAAMYESKRIGGTPVLADATPPG